MGYQMGVTERTNIDRGKVKKKKKSDNRTNGHIPQMKKFFLESLH